MFATWCGATRGASSMMTRPLESCRYSVLSGSGLGKSVAQVAASRSDTVIGRARASLATCRPTTMETAAAIADRAVCRVTSCRSLRGLLGPGLGLGRRCRDPLQHPVEGGTIEVTSREQHAADPPSVVDVVERVCIQQHEVGNLALGYPAHVRDTPQE